MRLTNQTPVPAEVITTVVECMAPRLGVITAKATFHFETGSTRLDTEDPFPLFRADQETELGLLPRDFLPRRDDKLEVILLGKAHAEGEPVARQRVSLAVGEERRELEVLGDRRWQEHPDGAPSITDPEPFQSMPLTWERAHGGACEVEIDREAFIEVCDPWNRHGRGFDAAAAAEVHARALQSPRDYPVVNHERLLPNLEHPDQLICGWDDSPEPICWATLPPDSGVVGQRLARGLAQEADARQTSLEVVVRDTPATRWTRDALLRAHPDWVIDVPRDGVTVALKGLLPNGPCSFPLPRLRVLADYVVGPRHGTRELAPQTLVLLPEQRRLYIVYRSMFTVTWERGQELAFRLRTEEGWFSRPQHED